MDLKRILAFVLTVLITLTVIGVSSPDIVRGIKLGLDLQGGFEILYKAEPLEAGAKVTQESLRETAKSLQQRADAYGVSEPEVTPEGSDRIRARIAGVSNQEEVRSIMKKPAELTFRGPDGTKEMIGSDFKQGAAQVGFNQYNQPEIQIEVNDSEKLRKVSEKLLHQPLAIYLDEQLLSAPVVQAVLPDGKATISGSYTFEEARNLANVINLGALPLKLTEVYTQSVGASLGQQSLQQTAKAGLIGSIFILLLMLFLYRLPGLIACITLITYTWMLLLVFDMMNATLTLPGIAAFVLGIGMAVDANIITYERVKEEIRSGKSLLSSLKVGYKNSLRTIMDANITTILAGVVLYYIGTGAIQGFALTLILSIAISMLTNVLFSRLLLFLLIRANFANKPAYYGVKQAEISEISDKNKTVIYSYAKVANFDFVKHRKRFFAFSSVVTILGIVTLLVFNMNYGVDFKAGTSLDISLAGKTIERDKAEQMITNSGFTPSSVTIGGDNQDRVSARFDTVLDEEKGEAAQIVAAFTKEYGDQVSFEENTVDPGIALELKNLAVMAVLISCLGIVIYVSVRFEWRFALASVIALLHCAFLVISIFSIFRLEVNLPFLAAILTIIGYSINDTIVIFDRIRENLRFAKIKTFEDLANLVNDCLRQTFSRTINTGISVIVASICLFIFGNESIKLFSLAMTLGLFSGLYTSLFIASQVWLVLKKNTLNARKLETAKE